MNEINPKYLAALQKVAYDAQQVLESAGHGEVFVSLLQIHKLDESLHGLVETIPLVLTDEQVQQLIANSTDLSDHPVQPQPNDVGCHTDKYMQFFNMVREWFFRDNYLDLDMGQFQEWATDLGLLHVVQYNESVHGEADDLEEGEEIYVLTDEARNELTNAGLLHEE